MTHARAAATLQATITTLEDPTCLSPLAEIDGLTAKEADHVSVAVAHLETALSLLLERAGDEAPRSRRWYQARVQARESRGEGE